jgi:Flp pilus assembly protein TadD
MMGRLSQLVAGIALVLLGVLSYERAEVFATAESVWRDTLARNDEAWAAHNRLALTLLKRNQLEEAERHLRRSLALHPHESETYNNLAHVLADRGDAAGAEAAFLTALDEHQAVVGPIHFNLAVLYVRLRRYRDAEASARRSVAFEPNNASAWSMLGSLVAMRGDAHEAIGYYRQAATIAPDSPDGHKGLATMYQQVGRSEDALAEWREVVRLNPGDAAAASMLQRLSR